MNTEHEKIKIEGESKPFIEREAACPVCGKTTTHLFLRDRTFVVEQRENDGFISHYHWIKAEYNRYDLYSFFFWHCPHCKFTEERKFFLKKKSDLHYKQKALINIYKKTAASDMVISHLTKYVKYPYMDNFSNLSLHLLAVYIQQLPKPHERDLVKIAKYLHRTSWVFRLDSLKSHREDRSALFGEYMKLYEMVQANYMNALASLEEMQQWLEKQFELEKQQNSPLWSDQENTIKHLYSTMTGHMDDILLRLKEYYDLGIRFKKQAAAQDPDSTSSPFHEYESYLDYLLAIKEYWPDIPIDEQLAIRSTIKAYQDIYQGKLYEDQKLKLFHILKTISYLYEKLGDHEKALNTAQILYNKARAFRSAASRRLQRLDIIKDERVDKKMLEDFIRKSIEIIETIDDRIKRLREKKIVTDFQRARDIYLGNRDISPEKLKTLLIKARIDESVIDKFFEEKSKENKKGIFQIFKL